jgi:2-haloacid dehalogenase
VPDRPSVVVFDVNETLSDMTPMAERFAEVGLPRHLAATWFASVLRDGFGLAAAGTLVPFAQIAQGVLRPLLVDAGIADVDGATSTVMSGFTSLSVHPDVPDGVRALRAAGFRLVTLSNGSASVAEGLLERAGLADQFERLLSVEDAGIWKPARGSYEYASQVLETPLESMLLVAVHPWDTDGAARAGMRSAWINRGGTPYPDHYTAPTTTASGLQDLAQQLGG